MELRVYATIAPLLPLTDCPQPDLFEALCATLARDGYYGIEAQVSQVLLIGKTRFVAALTAHNLRWIGKVYSSGGAAAVPHTAGFVSHPPAGRTVAEHLAVWEASVRECCTPLALRDLMDSISSQSGRDVFHRGGGAEADAWLSRALDVAEELGVAVHHETHRHRLLFSPVLTVDCLRKHARLRILGDLSHYCVVCEAPCGDLDLEEAISEIVPRIGHLHARVGFEEGPQVSDPRNPCFASHLEGHAKWWAAVFLAAQARGDKSISITPEFLPPPYAWTMLDGVTPVANVAEINAYMTQFVRELFARTILQ